jgi:hypothetical protein
VPSPPERGHAACDPNLNKGLRLVVCTEKDT